MNILIAACHLTVAGVSTRACRAGLVLSEAEGTLLRDNALYMTVPTISHTTGEGTNGYECMGENTAMLTKLVCDTSHVCEKSTLTAAARSSGCFFV